NPKGKYEIGKDVDLHLYRSMIGSLMYLTASRPDIMFVVCACARHQVTPNEFHLHAVKRIFRYLKGHPKLGIWYPKDSPFDLVAYSDSDYGGATQDRKSTTGGCQFLVRRLILWQCKKQTIVSNSTTGEYVAAASGCRQVLWIQNQLLDYGLAFCDYHNMISILEKYEYNVDFHQIVDFVEASHISFGPLQGSKQRMKEPRFSLLWMFWSTARIETTDEGTKILATVDGKPRPISESSIMRNLKLNDEAGISSLPDAELFENLALMGYNILPNQKFSFQKGQFSHHWKFLIHTIMQCLSPKSTGFNEFSSNIATAVGEGSRTPTEPHHTPSPEAQQSPQHDLSSSILPPSSALPTAVDEPASPLGDDSQGEAFPIVSGLEAEQDRENIIKTSALPLDSPPRVTSLAVDEGSMQHKLYELTDLCTRLQRQQTEMASKIAAQDLEITSLKARIKLLEDKCDTRRRPAGHHAVAGKIFRRAFFGKPKYAPGHLIYPIYYVTRPHALPPPLPSPPQRRHYSLRPSHRRLFTPSHRDHTTATSYHPYLAYPMAAAALAVILATPTQPPRRHHYKQGFDFDN
nr:uncharacterized mitochondrial protein AtMg00810-like [Tanacetum cinerariifolium]